MPKINLGLARKLIKNQFPQYAHLPVNSVKKQGHDNRTYRLGDDLLIRLPTAESYALKVPIEHKFLPQLAPNITVAIPISIKKGDPSPDFPYAFSIYKWLDGTSLNLLTLKDNCLNQLAFDLANFLKELQAIKNIDGPSPGQHNWWRGDHPHVYDKNARAQIEKLSTIIDSPKALTLWENACKTTWHNPPVWIHGDLAIGNILVKNEALFGVIDFGGMCLGDPACDLVITWTFFKGKSREIFIHEVGLDEDTWLRAKAWALWKATFCLCELENKKGREARHHRNIINEILNAQ